MVDLEHAPLSSATLDGNEASVSPSSKTSPKSKIYQTTMSSLHQSWLKQIQYQIDSPTVPSSVFDNETKLLEALFAQPFAEADKDTQNIFLFCSTLCLKAQNTLGLKNANDCHSTIDEVKEEISQIIYLAEKDLNAASQLIDQQDATGSLKKIKFAFEAELQKYLQEIKNLQAQHEKIPLHNPAAVASVKKPLLVASMLTTSTGLLNLGLIDTIKKKFYESDAPLKQHEKELLQTLEELKHSPLLQQQFRQILKPLSQNLASNDIIRVTLHLPPSTQPTNKQAQTVALAALLSDMRQGDVGSCFASSVSILMMGAMKTKVLTDFGHILHEGKLSRHTQGGHIDFFPVLDIGDSAVQNPIYITKDGKVNSFKGYLWEAPGLQSAWQQLEMKPELLNPCLQNLISQQFAKQSKPTTIIKLSAKEIIEYMLETKVKAIPTDSSLRPEQIHDMKHLAILAFCSETHTPLLRAWESCVAAMAESHESHHVRQKILKCVNLTLHHQWPSHLFTGLTNEAKHVQKVFTKVLDAGIQLRYDEHIHYETNEKGDGHSKPYGAFVLHEVTQGERSSSAKRVQTPEEFRSFILGRLKFTQEIFDHIENLQNREKYQEVIDHIRDYVSQRNFGHADFLHGAIANYDPANAKRLTEDLQNWKQLQHLPFRDSTGNDVVPVYNNATGFMLELPEIIRPKNAEQLLEAFIQFSRKRVQSDNFLDDDNPYQRYMATTPQHAFTLTPEDHTVIPALKSELSPTEWIQETIAQTGYEIANLPLSPQQKEKFIDEISRQLLPAELANSFKLAALSSASSPDTVHAFCEDILHLLMDFDIRQKSIIRSNLTASLTNILLHHVLTPDAAQKLSTHVVRIADTNWLDRGARHLYFACFFDPVTQSLQLGTIDEDGKELLALDQNEWVAYVPWEMYGVKLTPSITTHSMEVLSI